MNSWNTENSSGSGIILPNIVMVDMGHYTSVKTHTMYTKSEPQGKL